MNTHSTSRSAALDTTRARMQRPRPAAIFLKAPLLSGLCLLLLSAAFTAARAAATNGCNVSNSATVTFAMPTTLYMLTSLAKGQVIWTSSPTPASATVTITCNGTATNGILNNGANIPNPNTLFATNDPDIAYQIIRGDTGSLIPAYNSGSVISALTVDFTFQLQLVWNGGSSPTQTTFAPGTLGSWDFAKNGGQDPGNNVISFVATGSSSVAPPPCSVAVNPTVVTLPPVLVTALSATGSTAGQTPFDIQLNCSATGVNASITLSTATPQAGATGVVAPSAVSGSAQNVGVQILTRGNGCNASGATTPIQFNAAIAEGAISAGTCDLPFAAQYYQTATPATPGQVTATATYTLTYQ